MQSERFRSRAERGRSREIDVAPGEIGLVAEYVSPRDAHDTEVAVDVVLRLGSIIWVNTSHEMKSVRSAGTVEKERDSELRLGECDNWDMSKDPVRCEGKRWGLAASDIERCNGGLLGRYARNLVFDFAQYAYSLARTSFNILTISLRRSYPTLLGSWIPKREGEGAKR